MSNYPNRRSKSYPAKRYSIDFDVIIHNRTGRIVEWKVHDKDGVVFGYPQDIQIDFVIKNGEEYLGEIKSSAGSADVTVLSRKAKFYTQITGKTPKVLLVAVSINEECRKSCDRLNVQLITHDEL